jgi:phenylalanyl-tRNA synthetase alpha chain
MVTYYTNEVLTYVLTSEGSQIARDGSHEARVWAALPVKGSGRPLTPQQLRKEVGDESAKVGQGRAFKNGWIGKEGDGLIKLVCKVMMLVMSPSHL